jgi:hypothetical protein
VRKKLCRNYSLNTATAKHPFSTLRVLRVKKNCQIPQKPLRVLRCVLREKLIAQQFLKVATSENPFSTLRVLRVKKIIPAKFLKTSACIALRAPRPLREKLIAQQFLKIATSENPFSTLRVLRVKKIIPAKFLKTSARSTYAARNIYRSAILSNNTPRAKSPPAMLPLQVLH